MGADETTYSDKFRGDRGNYDWPVRFDKTSGYVGITQFEGDKVTERVLLSPEQAKQLSAFIAKR